MRSAALSISIFLIAVALAGIGYLGYKGIIPIPGDFFKASVPRDLGVASTEQDFNNFINKTQSQILPIESAKEFPDVGNKEVLFTKPIEYDMEFSNSQISARINYAKWSGIPVENVQVKFSEGNIVEVSGNLLPGKIKDFTKQAGVAGKLTSPIEKGIGLIEKLNSSPAFYIKAQVVAKDNLVVTNVQEVYINRVNISPDKAQGITNSAVESILKSVDGLYIDNAEFSEDRLYFKGNAPSIIYSKQN